MNHIKTGKFIALKRKEKEFTQKQLADKLGVSDKAVSRWECGKGFPDVSLLIPLCEILDISVNELLCGENLDASEYHIKAEENIVTLVKVLPTIIMPVVLFIALISVVCNFIAGLVYGIIKKWNRWILAGIALLNIFIIYAMSVLLYMMVLAFYVAG